VDDLQKLLDQQMRLEELRRQVVEESNAHYAARSRDWANRVLKQIQDADAQGKNAIDVLDLDQLWSPDAVAIWKAWSPRICVKPNYQERTLTITW
jgi:putative heme iron utilization protein